ncbi:MAG: hypothetical protein P8X70_01380 [Nanoarchaeota archaeon]
MTEIENRLLISPILKSLSWHREIFGYKRIIQNKKFKYGIKIKNIGNKYFEGAIISDIIIHQANTSPDCTIALNSDKTFKIPTLNPNEKVEIEFEENIAPFSGGVWLKFKLIGKEQIQTYQWDKANKTPAKSLKDNYQNLFSIENESSLQQKITNILIIFLTSILVMKEIYPFLLKWINSLL